ncbi:NADPH oxidase 4 [Lonchura striata]|uniref:NADPH oxidase 4 n=1 Tax=Lonchura striata TaxID=40157 RepID=A0A218V4T1_9PASE|nr:NADPH oxidase 4 [Lonchura striata domestica]
MSFMNEMSTEKFAHVTNFHLQSLVSVSFQFFWLSLNVWLFGKTFLLYNQGLQYYYLHQMLGVSDLDITFCPGIWDAQGWGALQSGERETRLTHVPFLSPHNLTLAMFVQLGLCVSRASASVLNLNCCLVLLPMCRVLLAFVRGSQKGTSSTCLQIYSGFWFFLVLHVAAHLVNALNFSENYNEEFVTLNAANYRGEDPRKLLFATEVEFTMGVLKYQTNLEEHPPGCFNPNKTLRQNLTVPKAFEELFPDYTTEPFPEDLPVPEPFVQNSFMRVCSEEPKFQSHFPETWFWISGPLCLYCVERLYRYIRSNKPVTITSVISHPSNVLEVRMVKDDFEARPGQPITECFERILSTISFQYVILHCPRVSALESHPFTLTMVREYDVA